MLYWRYVVYSNFISMFFFIIITVLSSSSYGGLLLKDVNRHLYLNYISSIKKDPIYTLKKILLYNNNISISINLLKYVVYFIPPVNVLVIVSTVFIHLLTHLLVYFNIFFIIFHLHLSYPFVRM